MEIDSFAQELDDIPSLIEDGVVFLGNLDSFAEQISAPSYLEADIVYLLLPKNVPITRETRFQWLLDHLNTVISVPTVCDIDVASNELEIISVISKESTVANMNKFLITTETRVHFLAHAYRFVYCIDMSPSQSAVDTQKGEILFDEILTCFKTTLEGLCREFIIPGSCMKFTPDLYLTVIVNTPFFLSPAQQVLVKGVRISTSNLLDIFSLVENQFYVLEGCIARVAAVAHDEIDIQRDEHEGIVGSLFYLNEPRKVSPNIPMVLPDVNFVNMLRYSMLAISLLPENSLSHVIVITDGVVAMPDSTIMESLLLQLHYDSIPVSFLKVGSSYHPNASAGYIAYTDLLNYMSEATLGSYLEEFPIIKSDCTTMNIYHESYLLWSFHTRSKSSINTLLTRFNKWRLSDNGHSNRLPLLLSKRQTEENITASVMLLLSRRMREGYTIDYLKYDTGRLEICLSLEWKAYIYIQYHITCQWPLMKNVAHIEVHILAPYEFLHDISYLMKKESKSTYRQAAIERFWLRLTQLSSGDTLLAQQLSSVHSSNIWYTLPESIRNGIPVFNLNGSDSFKLLLSPSHGSCTKFVALWQPICQVESTNWKKWFHTHKLSVILKYDRPLPKHLHLANSSGRFQVIQCRQAAVALHNLLATWSTFVLIDNHTYLKQLYRGTDRNPTWFCMIRVTSKLPCAILHLAFITGTPGYVRHEICEELKSELSSLYLSNLTKSKENACCTILQKPLERILIRYERMPSDFSTVIYPDGTQPPNSTQNLPPSPLAGSLFTTLSRYLYHRRWIWKTSYLLSNKLDVTAISRILSTLTRMRLAEGFNFAHSCSGIITMALELTMESNATCVVQYVLFPPSQAWRDGDFTSSSEEDFEPESEFDSELQMVTEVWIEPQFGRVQENGTQVQYYINKCYYEIASVIHDMDSECINSLLTLEQLSYICQNRVKSPVMDNSFSLRRISALNRRRRNSSRKNSKSSLLDVPCVTEIDDRIQHIPFKFDPISILSLCQQTEILFSMFMESSERLSVLNNYDYEKPNKLLLENIQDHLINLHDYELDLTVEQSNQLIVQILSRSKTDSPLSCHPSRIESNPNRSDSCHWRCFVKGISVTHIILTFIPMCLSSLKELVGTEVQKNDENDGRTSSKASNISDVSINITNSFTLPIYVYDCPLAMLINAYVTNLNKTDIRNKDIFMDHRFKFESPMQEDSIRLKSEDVTSGSPENKNEESETNDAKSNVKQHCKAVVLSYSKCFVLSLFTALQNGAYIHSSDVQSAMDLCDETAYTIDITEYLKTVCGHLKNHTEDEIDINILNLPHLCNELKPLHRLIKSKFFEILNLAFCPVSSNKEFYYYKNSGIEKNDLKADSDDEISIHPGEPLTFKSFKARDSLSDGNCNLIRMESVNSVYSSQYMSPLFLQLVCSVHHDKFVANTSVKVLPTCLGELSQNLKSDLKYLKKANLQITLDILCLTLPSEVQNVINDYSEKGLRTTSFCSDGFPASVGSMTSEASFISDFRDQLSRIPEVQQRAITNLQDKIRWLLQDEMATALLDVEPVCRKTLNFVTNHVQQSSTSHSCVLDRIDLNFVYQSHQSYEKFVQEFMEISIPNHELKKEEEFYYIAKSLDKTDIDPKQKFINNLYKNNIEEQLENSTPEPNSDFGEKNDDRYSQSDISSVNDDSCVGTEGGYDEDVSEDEEDFSWLIDLDERKQHLPNFWLIMRIEHDAVTIYFHCRFLELRTTHVVTYLQVQRAVRQAVRDLCKRVNQSLLLQSLHDTRTCDILLEPDDENKDWHVDNISNSTRNSSFSRLRSMDEASDESDLYLETISQESSHFKAGEFSCPIVWETRFSLHPRLKTGPGKSSLSRGILALKTVLDKFCVTNRNNMFVYQDKNSNVFYLRLHENLRSSIKGTVMRSNEYEHTIVSRSPSIASLPLGQHKNNLTQSQHSISSTTSRDSDIRPRVRSFGEKESKDNPDEEDTLTLKVHGITETGEDVRCELVQVLQNRLDDAVLEFLSIMLARNAMCPLTPEDVQFLQKPFRPPELSIKLTIQDFALNYLDAFVHYLRQNLLQFLNVPKYADSRSLSRFKDYSETDQSSCRYNDDNIFIYNQSQNPSSGSRGIACIALVIIKSKDSQQSTFDFKKLFENCSFDDLVATSKVKDNEIERTYLEFRLWKQGRVNTDTLFRKLSTATSQAMWDIIMEYHLLESPLCRESTAENDKRFTTNRVIEDDLIKPILEPCSSEIECHVLLNSNFEENVDADVKVKYESSLKSGEVPKVLISRQQKRYIPLNSTARRILQFDELKEKDIPIESDKNATITNMSSYEQGDEGILTETYSKTLFTWLEFGVKFSVPSVRKHTVSLSNRHLLNVTIKELSQLVTKLCRDTTKVFSFFPLEDIENNYCGEIYVPYNPSHFPNKCIIIARNFDQWKLGSNNNVFNSNILKHLQKFVPLVTTDRGFVPRQKLFCAIIGSNEMHLYTYNWSKDNVDKLIEQGKNVGLWLSMRASMFNSIIAQKLGLFYNQAITRKNMFAIKNSYLNFIGDVECLMKFPGEKNRRQAAGSASNQSVAILEAFRDSFRTIRPCNTDLVVIFAVEIQEMKRTDKKHRDELKKLHSMWQSRTSTCTSAQIQILIQNSRLIHFCHTPLLFLPRWRLHSASTRDHSLTTPAVQSIKYNMLQDQTPSDNESMKDWHNDLCFRFMSEYKQYLQTLGFLPLQIENTHKKHSIIKTENPSHNSIFYVQKAMLGGILIFTINLNEPFLITKLYAIECNRLQTYSRASINQFTLSFLDECDKIKVLIHLHSFTYDFHLRCIHNYVSNSPGAKVCEGYHLTHFLDNFMKYYNKAPNFARNLVHEETITIENLLIEGKHLYDYLLSTSNVGRYNMDVFSMQESKGDKPEFVLVQLSTTPQMSYKDSQDCHHTDDFDVTLIISRVSTQDSTENALYLKYYLILTSRREIYPKLEMDRKLGKFRTVSSTFRSVSMVSNNEEENKFVNNELDSKEHSMELAGSHSSSVDSMCNKSRLVQEEKSQSFTGSSHFEIKQESVNYLGYYSSHEQLMQQLILDRAHITRKKIKSMVGQGMVDCRTDWLWNVLVSPQELHLTYAEFVELKNLARQENLCDLNPDLRLLLNQPLSWYQGLAKLLLIKHSEQNYRTFVSPDGNIQHYVVLHPRYDGAFMLLSMDLHTSRGDLYAVYRPQNKHKESDVCVLDKKALLDGFINCICFYLWTELI